MDEKIKRTSKLAIASLVCGVLFFIPVLGIPAIILGICALKSISKYKDELKGKGLAIAGIILGSILIIVVLLGFFAAIIAPHIRK